MIRDDFKAAIERLLVALEGEDLKEETRDRANEVREYLISDEVEFIEEED